MSDHSRALIPPPTEVGSPVLLLLKHPDYSAAINMGNLRLRFHTPGSRFGAVYIVLSPENAAELIREIDRAFVAPAGSTERKV